MRRILTGLAVAAIAATGVAAVAMPAGAQTTPTLTCSFTLSSNTLPIGGGTVQVSGFAPGSTQVHVFLNGVEVAGSPVTSALSNPGAWGPISVNVTATSQIRVSIAPQYTNTPCLGVSGTEVETVSVAVAASALPRTGSETRQYVFAGAALLGVGLVLFVGAKRRRETQSRV